MIYTGNALALPANWAVRPLIYGKVTVFMPFLQIFNFLSRRDFLYDYQASKKKLRHNNTTQLRYILN